MKNVSSILLHKGEKFQSCGLGKFTKDILTQGVYIHPDTGQVVDLSDPARLQRLADNTARYRKNGNKVPFPDGHKFDSMSNLGDWDEHFIVKEGRLWGMVNPRGKDVEDRLATGKIDGVSAYIRSNVKDALGNVYPEVMVHICATDYPVIPGQRPFKAALAREGGEDVLVYLSKEIAEGTSPEGRGHIEKEGPMDPKKLALALGLAETATAEEILSAIAKSSESQKAALSKLKAQDEKAQALASDLTAHGLELKDGKVVKLAAVTQPAPSAREQELLSKLAIHEARENLLHAETAKKSVDEYVKKGVVPPAMAAQLSKLMAIKDKVQALSLSADGKGTAAVEVDIKATLTELLAGVQSVVGGGLSSLREYTGDDDKGEKSPKKLEEEGRKLARQAQGLKETA